MATKKINDTTLTAIASAIREKNGTTNTYKPSEMAAAIEAIETGGGGGELPEEAFLITGNCGSRFANGGWDWFLREYGDKITTQDIYNASSMFAGSGITEIPFDLNFAEGGCDCGNMISSCRNLVSFPATDFKHTSEKYCGFAFSGCENLTSMGELSNFYPYDMGALFQGCYRLRELPNFINLNLNRINTDAYGSAGSTLRECYSLRSIPEDFLKKFNGVWAASWAHFLNGVFCNCYALDEIKSLMCGTGEMSENIFDNYTFQCCSRAKEIQFALNDDGTPQTAKWTNQTLYLTDSVGYAQYSFQILDYNSGITADKEVTDDTTYQALKEDPDWFTTNVNYSRYNHDSAVNTINTLPDTSAYLATMGGTNTIQFKGEAGSATDGGAINTLTEEEIAVATVKGWTVSLA